MVLLYSKKDTLESLDEVYRDAIKHLPPDVRQAYCERLISRCGFDLRNNLGNKKTIKLLLKAARNEAKVLEEILK